MITNALPVILIGISVADAIHIFSEYYDLQARYPYRSVTSLVVETMAEMWRPVTLTTMTTVAGFLGLYLAADMPPFSFFGLFTAVGVLIAWLYSMLVLPAAMVLLKPRVHPTFIKAITGSFQCFDEPAGQMDAGSCRKSSRPVCNDFSGRLVCCQPSGGG